MSPTSNLSKRAHLGTSARSVLVTGATGHVGRHVVAGLVNAGVRVRALSRTISDTDVPDGVEVVRGDLSVAADVARAAEGMDAAFLVWMDHDATRAAAPVEALAALVRHVSYLSAADLQGEAGVMPGAWAEVEELLRATDVHRTFVRAGGFAANTLGWAEQIRRGDTVRLPHPGARRSLVHERDIADVAVTTLLDPEQAAEAYAVTGPEVLSQAEQVGAIGVALGRRLVVEEQDPEEARRELAAEAGEDFAAHALSYWASLVTRPERVSTDVERVTGHPARTFSSWAREHRTDFE